MIFTETDLPGVFLIDLEKLGDDRGFFARAFCQDQFRNHGLNPSIAQANVALSKERGTLRGMHLQYPPYAESKLVSVTRGSIVDVVVDLRPESPTFLEHISVELSAESFRAIYIPERFGHGYQTLEDATVTSYLVGEYYTPASEGGLSPFDPRLGIQWPLPVTQISQKDQNLPRFEDIEQEILERMTLPQEDET